MPTEPVGTYDRIWPVALLDGFGKELPCRYAILWQADPVGRGRVAWLVGVGDTVARARADGAARAAATGLARVDDASSVRLQIFQSGLVIPCLAMANHGAIRWSNGQLLGSDILPAMREAVARAYPKIDPARLPREIRRAGKIPSGPRSNARSRSWRLAEGV